MPIISHDSKCGDLVRYYHRRAKFLSYVQSLSEKNFSCIMSIIIDLIHENFEYEEHVMTKIKYHNLDDHNLDHSIFYANLTKMLYMYEMEPNSELLSELAKNIQEWIQNHSEKDYEMTIEYAHWWDSLTIT